MQKCTARMIPRSPRLQAYLQLASLSSCHKWESARSCVRLDQCVAAIWAVRCQYSCRPWHIGSQNTNRMPPVTPGILNDLSCLPHVAAASGWTEVDTWPLIHGGWVCENGAEGCHLISRGLCGINSRYTIIECLTITLRVAHSRERTENRDTSLPFLLDSHSDWPGYKLS